MTGGGGTPDVDFHVTEVVTAVGVNERRAAGLQFWVDGTMGFHRSGGKTLVVAPNGPWLARHDLTAGGFLTGLLAGEDRIQGLPDDVDHASGGPLYHDPASGQLLLVYHGETFRDGDHRDYYSFIGMAVSDDDGETFHDLGRIVTSWLDEHDPHRPKPVDMGSGALVANDGHLYVYFQDRGIIETRRELSVARAPIADVLAAAQERRTPMFRKYHDGRFDEPGLGGRSAELLGGARNRANWFDAAYVEPLGSFMLVYSYVEGMQGRTALWNHAAILSTDGIRWSAPCRLSPEPSPAEMLYVTVDSGGDPQRTITEDWFHLYRVRSTAPFRWDDARLERVTVRYLDRRTAPVAHLGRELFGPLPAGTLRTVWGDQ